MKSNNDFLYCISAKCSIDELKILFDTYGINFFNEEVITKKFFYDKIDYLIFDSLLNRKEFYEKLETAPPLKQNVSEIIFLEKNDYIKNKKNN